MAFHTDRRSIHLVALAATFILSLAPPAAAAEPIGTDGLHTVTRANSPVPVVTAAVFRRACISIWMGKYTGSADAVRKICDNENPTLLFTADALKQLEDLTKIAAALDDATWRRIAQKAYKDEPGSLGQAGAGSLLLPAGAINETAIVWGIAQFVADRAKSQVQAFAAKQLVDRVCTDDGRRLIPQSCNLLSKDPGIIEVIRMPVLLRTSARRDMMAAPPVVMDLLIEQNADGIRDHLDLALGGRMMLQAIVTSAQSRPAEEAIASMTQGRPKLDAKFVLSVEATPISTALYVGGLTIASIGEPFASLKSIFPRMEHVKAYTAKALLANLALGRPYTSPTWQGNPIWSCDPAVNPGFTCPFTAVAMVIGAAADQAAKLAALRTSLQAATTPPSKRAILVSYATELLAMMDNAASMEGAPDILTRASAARTGVQNIANSFAENEYTRALSEVIALPGSIGLDVHLPTQAIRGLGLAASVADADSASEVAKVIDNFVGGSRTYADKRAPSNGPYIMINAYGGGSLGWEKVNVSGSSTPAGSQYASAYVPVGVEFGMPLGRDFLWLFRSAGLFVQVIDVGALTSWRFQSTANVDQEPEVHFAQVLAPGASLMLGFRGIPMSLGVGVAASPRIRRVTANGLTEARGVVRFPMFSLSMDIPIFP